MRRAAFVASVLVVSWTTATAFAQPDGKAEAELAPPVTPPAATPGPSLPMAVDPPPASDDPSRGAFMRAYHEALRARKLAAAGSARRSDFRQEVASAEELYLEGRDTEVTSKLTSLIEHPDFALHENSEEGRAALYLLGRSLVRQGIYESGRAYLRRVLATPGAWKDDAGQARRAVRALVEAALETRQFDAGLRDVGNLPAASPPEVQAEVAYLKGRAAESAGDVDLALASYARVPQTSRFWSQATYLSGLIEIDRGRLREGENLFCKVADPKRQDQTVASYADERFFAVRDLARLALGRVAHDQYRFDDARYYYYLVPQDSDRLAEALYESATSRYEKKDYEGARELLRQLSSLGIHHRYEDEVWILDAYIDLALCRFKESDAKLRAFLKTYEPVRNAARRFAADPRGTEALLLAARRGADSANVDVPGVSASAEELRTVAMLVRVDPSYVEILRARGVLEREQGGLRAATKSIEDLRASLATTGGVRPTVADGAARGALLHTVRASVDATRRELRELESAHAPEGQVLALRGELAALEARLPTSFGSDIDTAVGAKTGSDLSDLLAADAKLAKSLEGRLDAAHAELETAERALAKDALHRLDLRLSRLLRRARLGRIETVLGKKHALEVEVEALHAGLLPRDALDALDAARYLRDDEEYWPFEGDDWPDEYVGSEGLR